MAEGLEVVRTVAPAVPPPEDMVHVGRPRAAPGAALLPLAARLAP